MKNSKTVTSYQKRFFAEQLEAERELREVVGELFGVPARRARLEFERKLPEQVADHLTDCKTPWIWETDFRPLAGKANPLNKNGWVIEIDFKLPMAA